MLITLEEYYMGREKVFLPLFTQEVQRNASLVVEAANRLLSAFGESRRVTSGWRPPEVNAATPHASAHSNHMTAQAVDLEDKDRRLAHFCNYTDVLDELGIWIEETAYTPTWVHVQIVPPCSGKRRFIP